MIHYETLLAGICEDHGWDYYSDDTSEHWDEMSDAEKDTLIATWHNTYGEIGEPGWDYDIA